MFYSKKSEISNFFEIFFCYFFSWINKCEIILFVKNNVFNVKKLYFTIFPEILTKSIKIIGNWKKLIDFFDSGSVSWKVRLNWLLRNHKFQVNFKFSKIPILIEQKDYRILYSHMRLLQITMIIMLDQDQFFLFWF